MRKLIVLAFLLMGTQAYADVTGSGVTGISNTGGGGALPGDVAYTDKNNNFSATQNFFSTATFVNTSGNNEIGIAAPNGGGTLKITSGANSILETIGASSSILYVGEISSRRGIFDGAANPLFIDAANGNAVVGATSNSDSQLAVIGSSANSFILRLSTTTTGTASYVAVSTNAYLVTNTTQNPTIGSCGTGSPSVSGDDSGGIITTGTGAPTACSIVFGHNWNGGTVWCVSNDDSTTIQSFNKTVVNSSATFGMTAGLTSGHIYYHCGCSGTSCR